MVRVLIPGRGTTDKPLVRDGSSEEMPSTSAAAVFNRDTTEYMKSHVELTTACGGCGEWSGVATETPCDCGFTTCEVEYVCLVAY